MYCTQTQKLSKASVNSSVNRNDVSTYFEFVVRTKSNHRSFYSNKLTLEKVLNEFIKTGFTVQKKSSTLTNLPNGISLTKIF